MNKQKYKKEYASEFQFISQSEKGEHFAKCTICKSDFSVAHSGRYDVKSHCASKRHTQLVSAASGTKSIFNMGARQIDNDNTTINAECLMTSFIVAHNLPLSVADHMTPLLKAMFPKSEQVQKYACRRTKSTEILHELSNGCKNEIVDIIKNNPYSLATDGSADKGGKNQMYPLVIRYYSQSNMKVSTGILSVPDCTEESSTGINIFNMLNRELDKFDLSWDNCMSFCSDNAPVMMGLKSGVASSVLKENPNIFLQGCACHLIHLAAGKAAQCLAVKLDELLTDIYYHLDKSSKRHKQLNSLQMIYNDDTKKIVRYCSTRWLSMQQCLTRLLELWQPIHEFFKQEQANKKSVKRKATDPGPAAKKKKSTVESGEVNKPAKSTTPLVIPQKQNQAPVLQRDDVTKSKDVSSTSSESCDKAKHTGDRVERVNNMMDNPMTKLVCLFLDATVGVFNEVNLLLQRDEPCIHILKRKCIELLTNLYVRFLKPEAIQKAKDIFCVKYKDRKNQKDREMLVIGQRAKEYIRVTKENQTMSSSERTEFYDSVRAYFEKAVEYIISKFPLQDELLSEAEVADISVRSKATFKSVQYFLNRFPCLEPNDIDALEIEFLKYQSLDLPQQVLECERVDTQWSLLTEQYPALAKVILGILIIPHSNADSERAFSMIRKNQTEFRPNMQMRTLESLVVLKTKMLSSGKCCFEQKFSSETLLKAKKATKESVCRSKK